MIFISRTGGLILGSPEQKNCRTGGVCSGYTPPRQNNQNENIALRFSYSFGLLYSIGVMENSPRVSTAPFQMKSDSNQNMKIIDSIVTAHEKKIIPIG